MCSQDKKSLSTTAQLPTTYLAAQNAVSNTRCISTTLNGLSGFLMVLIEKDSSYPSPTHV